MDRAFWTWLLQDVLGDTDSSVDYYVNGEAKPEEVNNAIKLAYEATAADSPERIAIVDALQEAGAFTDTDDPTYFHGEVSAEDVANLASASERTVARTGDAPATGVAAAPENQGLDRSFWEWALRDVLGDTGSDIDYYVDGRATAADFNNAIKKAYAATDPGSAERRAIIDAMATAGLFQPTDDLTYWYGETGAADLENLGRAAEATVAAGSVPVPPAQRAGTATVGGQTIPAGMRLVRITNPVGSDSGELFMLVGTVYGVDFAYRVGTREDLNATFGSIDAFGNITTVTQAEFDGSDSLEVGTVDEILGAGESLQAQFDRDMRAAGLEAPPAWLVEDKTAMLRYVTAVNEGWSAERMYTTLSTTEAFKNRFVGLDTVMGQMATSSWVAGIAEYQAREANFRSVLVANRGVGTDTSQGYISNLIAGGWQAAEVTELLGLERRMKDNPEALDNINQILSFQGMPTLEPDDFISFLADQDRVTLDPSFVVSDLYEGINDALRYQALLDQGLDIGLGFASDLGSGYSDAIGSVAQYSERARIAAIEVARNADDLELGRYGLERNDVIAAMFNEESPTGKASSEVTELLEKLGRERSKRATGFASSAAYTDALGRLRVQGFANL